MGLEVGWEFVRAGVRFWVFFRGSCVVRRIVRVLVWIVGFIDG